MHKSNCQNEALSKPEIGAHSKLLDFRRGRQIQSMASIAEAERFRDPVHGNE